MSTTTLTLETHTCKRSYEGYATESNSQYSKKRHKTCDAHKNDESIPSAQFAKPLLPQSICDRRVTTVVHQVVSPPGVQRSSLLSYNVPTLSSRSTTILSSSGKDVLVGSGELEEQSGEESASEALIRPKRQSDLQKMGIASFSNPLALTDKELQNTISTLFIEMAKKISSSDPHATLYPKLALKLNPREDAVKAQLLMTLGNAHFKKMEAAPTDRDSINTAINYYKEGRSLINISPNQKALFSLNLGNAYLARKYSGDADKAIASFDEGLKLETKDYKLLADLCQGKSNAFMHKLRHSSSSSSRIR